MRKLIISNEELATEARRNDCQQCAGESKRSLPTTEVPSLIHQGAAAPLDSHRKIRIPAGEEFFFFCSSDFCPLHFHFKREILNGA